MENELDLYALWQVLVKRWKLLVIFPLFAALASALVSIFLITPQYSAQTTLMVTRPTDTSQILYQDIQVSRQLVNTYREIVHSRRVLDLVIANRSLPYSSIELREMVEVQSVRDTELITVMVTHEDPGWARDVANEVARVFMEEINEIMQIENVSVVDEAVMPGSPISPRIPMNVAVAFALGLMGAFGLVFLLEYLDQTVKDPAEVQRMLEVPVIGMVPQSSSKETLITLSNPRSPASEAFRTLRTNIQYSRVDSPIKKILVTGGNPDCGKSTVSANLAVTLAQSGKPVLLVDADLRRPVQHKLFGLSSEPGLSSIIFNENISLSQALRKTEHGNLTVLPCGPIPPYPAEMIASARMKALVNQLSETFEYIIFDSPPTTVVTDATILSKLVDGTLLVFDYGRARKDDAAAVAEQLKMVQAHIVGVVINMVPQANSYYSGYYNYYYYGRSGDVKVRRNDKRRSDQGRRFDNSERRDAGEGN